MYFTVMEGNQKQCRLWYIDPHRCTHTSPDLFTRIWMNTRGEGLGVYEEICLREPWFGTLSSSLGIGFGDVWWEGETRQSTGMLKDVPRLSGVHSALTPGQGVCLAAPRHLSGWKALARETLFGTFLLFLLLLHWCFIQCSIHGCLNLFL